MGCDLTRSPEGIAQIFGFPLGKANLSDGQKVLLQLCVAIHSQGASLNSLILLMDEPENHLHPSLLIEVIDKIREQVTEGQLWIATHSLTLLSHLDTSCIWYMDDNKIGYSGRQPEKVLRGLLGNEIQISRFADFLSLPAHFAANRFAYESLFQPSATQTDIGDAQTSQITGELRRYKPGESIRVIDYGAGKGRLADAVFYSDSLEDKNSISNWFDYIAFDAFAEDKCYCEMAIQRIYGTSENRYFNDEYQVLGRFGENSVDVVVMCNVLHEIPPTDWLRLFSTEELIVKCLKNDGVVLLVEDLLLPVGEKPHRNGFCVLGLSQVKALFQIEENCEGFRYADARGDNRLVAYQIPKSHLSRISSNSRKNALQGIAAQAKSEIRRLRSAEASYKNGKLLGFWVQQFANAQLCLEEI